MPRAKQPRMQVLPTRLSCTNKDAQRQKTRRLRGRRLQMHVLNVELWNGREVFKKDAAASEEQHPKKARDDAETATDYVENTFQASGSQMMLQRFFETTKYLAKQTARR